MQPQDRKENPIQPCEDFEPQLVLFLAGELDPSEQADLGEHIAHCAVCAAALEREKELLALVVEHRAEPDAAMLASFRAGLDDALDREEERGRLRRWIGPLLPSSWLAPRPAWSAALLLVMGFSVGILGPRLLRHPSAANPPIDSASTETLTSEPAIHPIDLHTADVAGINVLPSAANEPPQVQVQLKAERPFTMQGTVNNDDVKSVLLFVLGNSQRFDPDVRLDAVDLLRARNNDPDVRTALCHAVHTDHNAAVRLKALEALNGAEPQDLIRQTLLDALVDDQNPGVRVEAINALRDMAANGKVVSDDHMLAVLRDRMQKDPNTYIRLQSAAAIQDLGPRQKF
jgi:anti-sigma factor RsiW